MSFSAFQNSLKIGIGKAFNDAEEAAKGNNPDNNTLKNALYEGIAKAVTDSLKQLTPTITVNVPGLGLAAPTGPVTGVATGTLVIPS